jgi:hypothetical protein
MMARAPRRFGLGTSVPSRICRACHTLQVNLNPPPGPRPPPALPSDSATRRRRPCRGSATVRRNAFARDRDPSPPPCYVGGRRAVAGDSAAAAAAAAVGACGPGLPTRSPSGQGRLGGGLGPGVRRSVGQQRRLQSGFESQQAGRRIGLRRRVWPDGGPVGPGRAGARAGRGRSVSEPAWRSRRADWARGLAVAAAGLVPIPGPTAATRP